MATKKVVKKVAEKKVHAPVKEKKVKAVKPTKSSVELVSFGIKATIPVMTFGNIQPEVVVKAKTVEEAQCVWDIVDMAYTLRDDLTIIFVAHTQTGRDDSGYLFTRIKTSGKKLDKICLESKFTTVLIAKCINGEYVFETHANNSTAKSPMGLFNTDTIPNDITSVIKVLEEYEN